MNRINLKKYLKKTSKKYPAHLVEIPYAEWPEMARLSNRIHKIMRSDKFLVQIIPERNPCLARLTVNRTEIEEKSWKGNITWDELMQIKRECGYKNFDALEVYPMDEDIINVSNMRHLFIMEYPVEFAWRNT